MPITASMPFRSRMLALFAALFLAAPAIGQGLSKVSLSSGGGEANGASTSRSLSGDGSLVAFTSDATDLITGDLNGASDVFLRDRATGTTVLVSANPFGQCGNGSSSAPALSGDGRFCAFVSSASDLVAGDSNGKADIFLRDLTAGTTVLVSVSTAGVQGDGDSSGPWVDWNGDVVAFASAAKNLVPGDSNNFQDIFVRDLSAFATSRVSVATSGAEGNGRSLRATVTHDGLLVCFASAASNLVSGDGNNRSDCFVHDRTTGTTTRVSVASAGPAGNDHSGDPEISGDGSVVVFDSLASNLVPGDTNLDSDVFLHDRASATTVRISVDAAGGEVDLDSVEASVSTDGNVVCFSSQATTLVPGDTNGVADVFIVERDRGLITRISLGVDGSEADADCENPELSNDGYVAIFESAATTLVGGDGAGVRDVFAHATPEVGFVPYGAGLAGSGGFVPALTGVGGRGNGDFGYFAELTDGLGFAPGLLLVSTGDASFPLFGGTGLVDFGRLLASVPILLSGPFGSPGAGEIVLDGVDVTEMVDVSIYLQIVLVDSGAQKKISISNGLEMQILGR
jgi:Tol biopolymer transport system component